MPSMIIGDWCQGLFVWGNLGTSFDSSRMAGKMLMWMSYSLTCLQGSLWLFYVSQSRQISKLGHRSACVWSAAFVKFNWEASWVPGFHFSPTKTKHKKWNNPKEILCMPSEPPMLPFISDICLASASWTSSYCLFITCFALITCSWWWRRRRWWDGAGDGPAEKSDSHTYWNYCFIIISKEFWPTLEC